MARDPRLTAPRLMSRAEFTEHCRDWHGALYPDKWTRSGHERSHHLSSDGRRHGHRPAPISEPDHPDWS